jgi:hypothetical protein
VHRHQFVTVSGRSKPAISIAGIGAGRRSRCERLAEMIAAQLEDGLSARRIYQDLVEQNDLITEGKVTFRYKDFRHDTQQKTMTLEAGEFILKAFSASATTAASRYREQKLAHCRELL